MLNSFGATHDTEGRIPEASLIADDASILYGTTNDGAANDYSSGFELAKIGFVVPGNSTLLLLAAFGLMAFAVPWVMHAYCGRNRLSLIVATALLTILANNRVEAAIIISTPAGLQVGQTFRILFVTDGLIAATSASTSTYNTFVNADATTEAGAGGVTYNGASVSFDAIVSTATENATQNIGNYGSSVFLASGTPIASTDGSTGLWSGALLNPPKLDLQGLSPPGSTFVWTGTGSNGSGVAGNTLGTASPEEGFDSSRTATWVKFTTTSQSSTEHIYGISAPLTVTAVPEQPAFVLLSVVGFGVLGVFVRRRIGAAQGR